MAFLQQLAMALSSIRGGPGADSPGSRRHGAARPARVSILPGDPPANDASVEGSPRSFGSGGMGIGLSQYVMSQQSQSSSDTSTLLFMALYVDRASLLDSAPSKVSKAHLRDRAQDAMSHFLKKGLRRQNSIQQTISWGADAPAAQTCTLK
ncbi:hypothetical protein THAOC_10648, partial [Thalassiosira oceanica]